jgi:hypothetical protein
MPEETLQGTIVSIINQSKNHSNSLIVSILETFVVQILIIMINLLNKKSEAEGFVPFHSAFS